MRKSALLRAAAVLAAVVWAMPASAQEQRGSIEGAVRDNSGGVLPGVTVQARNVTTNAMQSSVTDANGVYRFPALQPGSSHAGRREEATDADAGVTIDADPLHA